MRTIASITGGIGLFLILFYMISGFFLSYEKPVESSFVLLESWISYSIVEDASKYVSGNNIDSVFVVGMKDPITSACLQEIDKTRKLQKNRNTYALYWDGILGFEIPSEKLKESFILSVKMRGTSDSKHFPHYEIFVNKQVIGAGFVQEKDSSFEFIISEGITDSLTYILINFDNDNVTSTGDRNLFVSDISIDSIDIDSLTTNNFFISKLAEPNIKYVSKLNTLKYYMKDLGYDTSRVKLMEVNYDPINKSLALAKGIENYFINTDVKNINIITANKHSRRSYLNFKNCLEENIEVGCIPVNSDIQEKNSLSDGIDERVSLLLTWIYWWFN